MAQSGSTTAALPPSLQAIAALVEELSAIPEDRNYVASQAVNAAWLISNTDLFWETLGKRIHPEYKSGSPVPNTLDDNVNLMVMALRTPEIREDAIDMMIQFYKDHPLFKGVDILQAIKQMDALLAAQTQLMELIRMIAKPLEKDAAREKKNEIQGDNLQGILAELVSPFQDEQFRILSQQISTDKLRRAMSVLDGLLLYAPNAPSALRGNMTTLRNALEDGISCRDPNKQKPRTNAHAQTIAIIDQTPFIPSPHQTRAMEDVLAEAKVHELLATCKTYLSASLPAESTPPSPEVAAVKELHVILTSEKTHHQRLIDCEAHFKTKESAGVFPKPNSVFNKFTASIKQRSNKEVTPLDEFAASFRQTLAKEAQKKSFFDKIAPSFRSISPNMRSMFKPSSNLKQKVLKFQKKLRTPRIKQP